MTPEQQKPFWTLSNDELIRFALSKVKPTISATVERKRKYLEDHYGFKRSIASRQPASAPAPSPTPGAPPAPRPSPPPAGGASPAPSLASIIAQKLTSTGGQN